MANSAIYDPSQRPNLHHDLQTFDDPIRKVGPDVTANFDNSESNPTEWAGSEALGSVTAEEQVEARRAGRESPAQRVHTDAPDTGIDDADRADAVLRGDENLIPDEDEEGLDVNTDKELIDENGFKKIV